MHSKIQATHNTIWKGWLYLRSWAFLSKKLKGYLRKKKKEEKWEGKWICDSSTLPPKHCKEEYYLEILHRYDCRDWDWVMFFIQKRLHEYSARITQTKRDAGYHQAISRMVQSSSPNYCFHFLMTEQTLNFSIFGVYICEY